MGPAAAHVFVEDLDHPELARDDRHHLLDVLRLRAGDEITVSDGAGGWRRCQVGPGPLEPLTEVARQPRPVPPIAVAFALAKGERPEWTVQKLTELGADRIVPFTADRSVVRWPAGRAPGQIERLRRIAKAAASQSRRVWLPEIAGVATFADLVAEPGAALAHPGGAVPSLGHAPLLVGPEGGWSGEELDEAARLGRPRVGLGPHVLRSETAALAAAVLLAARRNGLA